ERMPHEAQNAFLKTLEEPPGECVFLLTCCQETVLVLPVVSRLRRYDFLPLSPEKLEGELKRTFASASEEKFRIVTSVARGRPGIAIRLLGDDSVFQEYASLQKVIRVLLGSSDLRGSFSLAEQLDQDPQKLAIFMQLFSLELADLGKGYLRSADHPLKRR